MRARTHFSQPSKQWDTNIQAAYMFSGLKAFKELKSKSIRERVEMVKSLLFQFHFVCFIFRYSTLFSISHMHWSQLFCSTLPIGKWVALAQQTSTQRRMVFYMFFFCFVLWEFSSASFKSFKFILVSFLFLFFFILFDNSHISLLRFAFLSFTYISSFSSVRCALFALSISYLSVCVLKRFSLKQVHQR